LTRVSEVCERDFFHLNHVICEQLFYHGGILYGKHVLSEHDFPCAHGVLNGLNAPSFRFVIYDLCYFYDLNASVFALVRALVCALVCALVFALICALFCALCELNAAFCAPFDRYDVFNALDGDLSYLNASRDS